MKRIDQKEKERGVVAVWVALVFVALVFVVDQLKEEEKKMN
jgi:hypothetical protein